MAGPRPSPRQGRSRNRLWEPGRRSEGRREPPSATCTSCGSERSQPARSRPAACAGPPASTAAWGLRARRATVSGSGFPLPSLSPPFPVPFLAPSLFPSLSPVPFPFPSSSMLPSNGFLSSTALKRLREAANGNDLDTGENSANLTGGHFLEGQFVKALCFSRAQGGERCR